MIGNKVCFSPSSVTVSYQTRQEAIAAVSRERSVVGHMSTIAEGRVVAAHKHRTHE